MNMLSIIRFKFPIFFSVWYNALLFAFLLYDVVVS